VPVEWKVALRFADRFLMAPGPPAPGERAELEQQFSPAELTELALGLGLFHGFSKVLIGLGLEPEAMDTTVYPTPDFATGAPEIGLDDPHVALLAECPELAARWALTYQALWETAALEPALLDTVRSRVAELLGVGWAPAADPADGPAVEPVLGVAELFVTDVRGIDTDQIDQLRELVGEAGTIQLFVGLALWDGIYRVDLTLR